MRKHRIAVELGGVVRRLRVAAGLSQESLAAKAGLHRTYIGAIERGEKSVTVEMLSRIGDALEVSLPEIFRQLEERLVARARARQRIRTDSRGK
jgi:transcriptional regulator with XRE-family HTH domain